VGMNRFVTEEGSSVPLLRIDAELERQQVERLAAVRAKREEQAVRRALEDIESAARSDDNLMPHIVKAVEQYATLGEISDRLRSVFGEYTGETYD
jgi:methylmalonyl-CoA mutase N-terminal domain/subunit